MKPKLVEIIQVCVVTALVVAPALVMGGIIWHKHLDFVAPPPVVAMLEPAHGIAVSPPKSSCLLSSTASALSLYPFSTQVPMVVGGICIGLCAQWIGLYVGRKLSRFYHRYRASVLKEQVATLERVWQQGM